MRTVAGADQPEPLLFLQERYPFPYLPPTMKAPVLRLGTMTMQCAFSSRSCGIPLSGVAITSEKTDAASPKPMAGSLSIASNDVVMANPATITNLIVLASSVAGIRCDCFASARWAPPSPWGYGRRRDCAGEGR